MYRRTVDGHFSRQKIQHQDGIKHILIVPGSPTQNAYIESFNGTFRDECLNENWFESLEQARQTSKTVSSKKLTIKKVTTKKIIV